MVWYMKVFTYIIFSCLNFFKRLKCLLTYRSLIWLGIHGQKLEPECHKYQAPFARGTCKNFKHIKSAECNKVCQSKTYFDGRCELFQDKGGLKLGCFCYSGCWWLLQTSNPMCNNSFYYYHPSIICQKDFVV